MIRPTDEPLRATDIYDAESNVLADMDTIADWLYSSCIGHGAVSSEWTERIPEVRIPQADVPTLLHMLLSSEHPAAVELRKRFLAEQQPRVLEIAGEAAIDRRL